jgi:hypothetical protein
MDRQDEHPNLASPKCDERRQSARAWADLMRPSTYTTHKLSDHYETRRFSFIRVAPLPSLPKPEPKEVYKGAIYETVFLPDDPKLAKKLGLPESYTFRHGVTKFGFKVSLHNAIERKLPSSRQGSIRVHSMLRGAADGIGWAFNRLDVRNYDIDWRDGKRDVMYSIHSTTHAEAAAALVAERRGKKPKGIGKLF